MTGRSTCERGSHDGGLTPGLLWMMAITAGVSVANLYYNQPLLSEFQKSFHATVKEVGVIPALTQAGYALGMLFLVPLGDRIERRKLCLAMTAGVVLALAAAALSTGARALAVASLFLGLTTIIPQILIPFVAHLSSPRQRGRAVGMVMSGLLFGILLARTVSGFVGARFGWRVMYWSASALMVAVGVTLWRALPKDEPAFKGSYAELLASLATLTRREPVLREAALMGAAFFGAFSAFWATLIFLLQGPPFHYGPEAAGLFGLIVLSFGILWVSRTSLLGLIVGVVLLDAGVQAAQISNQARIYSLSAEARSRVNTVYMFSYFCGGGIGSWIGNPAGAGGSGPGFAPRGSACWRSRFWLS